jgi:hypothetical protein
MGNGLCPGGTHYLNYWTTGTKNYKQNNTINKTNYSDLKLSASIPTSSV